MCTKTEMNGTVKDKMSFLLAYRWLGKAVPIGEVCICQLIPYKQIKIIEQLILCANSNLKYESEAGIHVFATLEDIGRVLRTTCSSQVLILEIVESDDSLFWYLLENLPQIL